MPKIDDILKNGTTLTLAIGGVVLAAAIIPSLPHLLRSGRPTARSALKTGLMLVEKGKEFMAVAGEEFDDMLAEVRAELQVERNEFSGEYSGKHSEDGDG